MYFHILKLFHISFILLKNIVNRLSDLKSKTKVKKEKAKNLLSNSKLLSFKFVCFYKLIKNKYNKSYHEFFIYFEKYYLSSKKFSKEIWN